MSYFVTGATGFIGRHLVERLLDRDGDIYVLVREGSRDKLDQLIDEKWEPTHAGALQLQQQLNERLRFRGVTADEGFAVVGTR